MDRGLRLLRSVRQAQARPRTAQAGINLGDFAFDLPAGRQAREIKLLFL